MSDPKDASPADPRIGTVLAERFRVDALLGKGGMGSVYRAEHVHMKKTVAVKVLHREMTGLDEIVKRFEREAIAAGRITHPNVAAATDFGQLPDGSFYLVLEYVPGKSLREILAGSGRLPLVRALGIARQVAAALAAAHAMDIVHRDLKPDNVMLVDKGEAGDFVKVLDFGIAKVAGVQRAGTQLTQMGTVFGTPQYMAPEQAAGQPVDHRADLYALGLILHEMLAGKPTFESDELIVLITMQLTAAPPPLPNDVPTDVARLVTRLLDKSPSERPASATEVAGELDAAIRRIESGVAARATGPSRAGQLLEHARQWSHRARPLLVRARHVIAATGRRRIAGKVPVWAIATALVVGVITWRALGDRHPAPITTSHRGSTESTESNDDPVSDRPAAAGDGKLEPEVENLVMLASRGDPGAVSQLKKLAPSEGSARVWLALARGLLRSRDVSGALDAYRRAIDLDAGLKDDSTMLAGLAYFGGKDDTFDAVLDFAVGHMGQSGADLVFFIWSATSERTPATQRARELLSSRAVEREMSEGLRLALAVRNAKGCDEFKELLPKLRDAGDERSYVPLRDLSRTTGCGPDGREDCYQCLRDDSLLKDALVQVQLRKAPHFETRRWR